MGRFAMLDSDFVMVAKALTGPLISSRANVMTSRRANVDVMDVVEQGEFWDFYNNIAFLFAMQCILSFCRRILFKVGPCKLLTICCLL
jgi:hypothetical protein